VAVRLTGDWELKEANDENYESNENAENNENEYESRMNSYHILDWLIWLVGAIAISWFDIRERKIRNDFLFIFSVLLFSFPIKAPGEAGEKLILTELNYALCNFILYLLFYLISRKRLGGGDIKLAIPIGIYLSFFVNTSLLLASFYAFLFASGVLILKIVFGWIMRGNHTGWQKISLPFAPFLFSGATCAILFH
jgi:prepilin signal peptidase PulO-like enzyme (type II secretory pathway)